MPSKKGIPSIDELTADIKVLCKRIRTITDCGYVDYMSSDKGWIHRAAAENMAGRPEQSLYLIYQNTGSWEKAGECFPDNTGEPFDCALLRNGLASGFWDTDHEDLWNVMTGPVAELEKRLALLSSDASA